MNRAQVIGLWNTAVTMGAQVKVNLLSQDDYGHIVVEMSEPNGASRRDRLLVGGGVEEIGRRRVAAAEKERHD